MAAVKVRDSGAADTSSRGLRRFRSCKPSAFASHLPTILKGMFVTNHPGPATREFAPTWIHLSCSADCPHVGSAIQVSQGKPISCSQRQLK